MIEKLTPEQEAMLPGIRDEWLAAGLSTEPTDWEAAKEGIQEAYTLAGLEPPKVFVYMPSPMTGCICAAWLAETEIELDKYGDVGGASGYRPISPTAVGSGVTDAASTREIVLTPLTMTVDHHARRTVWDALLESVEAIKQSLGEDRSKKIRDQIGRAVYGQHEAGWLAFYDVFLRCGLDAPKKLVGLMKAAKACGWWWPFEGLTVISARPVELHRNAENQLHKDGGMALWYPDGWGVWALNGVRVPEWLAKLPAEEINPADFATITNVEIRREFLRKVGMERISQKCGTRSLDKDEENGYELVMVNLGGETGEWPYLVMRNPSIGCLHMEAVSRECKCIQDAINFRASQLKNLNGDWKPEVLT